jgi:hypothetical protein
MDENNELLAINKTLLEKSKFHLTELCKMDPKLKRQLDNMPEQYREFSKVMFGMGFGIGIHLCYEKEQETFYASRNITSNK